MAGESAERQENAVIRAITNAVRSNDRNPVTLVAGKTIIEGVVKAYKYTGRQAGGSEPYTDVVIETYDGKKYNCSLKGESAPSLAGGGLRGLELAVPGIANKFMMAAFNSLKSKLKAGDKVPDVFGKISGADKMKIVVGNAAMGGPIDFMYIGKMDVTSRYDSRNNRLIMSNGELIPAKEYARTHDLFFRLRARREDQRFDPKAKDTRGTPKIYGVSPSKGDSAGRIVVTDKAASTGVIVSL